MIRPRITFADRVSHEFRTPLTVIKEYSALMRDGVVGEISEEHQRMLRVVEDRADDLHNLVDNLLHHSQLDTNSQRAVRQRLPLEAVLERVQSLMQAKAEMLGIEFRLQVECDAPTCFGDEELLTRSLLNLTQYALKHRDPKLPSLYLYVRSNGPMIEFQITCCPEAAAGGGDEADVDVPADFGLSVSVAEQLLRLQLGDLQYQLRDGRCELTASLPAYQSGAIVDRYLEWLGDQGTAGHVSALLLRTDDGENAVLVQLNGLLNYVADAQDLVLRHSDTEWLIVTPSAQRASMFQDEVSAAQKHLGDRGGALPQLVARQLGAWPRIASGPELHAALANYANRSRT